MSGIWLPCQEESDEDDEPAEASVTAEEMEEWKARLLRRWRFDRVVHLRCQGEDGGRRAVLAKCWFWLHSAVILSVEVTER